MGVPAKHECAVRVQRLGAWVLRPCVLQDLARPRNRSYLIPKRVFTDSLAVRLADVVPQRVPPPLPPPPPWPGGGPLPCSLRPNEAASFRGTKASETPWLDFATARLDSARDARRRRMMFEAARKGADFGTSDMVAADLRLRGRLGALGKAGTCSQGSLVCGASDCA